MSMMIQQPASLQWTSKKESDGKYGAKRGANVTSRGRFPPGINNVANDCFCNSVLQALIATSLLEDFICFRESDNPSMEPSLSPALTNGRPVAGPAEVEWTSGMQLSDLFLQLMETAYRIRDDGSGVWLDPRDIIRHLGTKFDQYLDFRQQDAHELLRHLLDAMYMDEMDIIKKREPLPEPKKRAPHRTSNYSRPPSRGAGPLDTVLDVPKMVPFSSAIFGGRLASVIVCNTCKHVSHIYEDFLDLSIPIKTEEERKKSRLRSLAQIFSSSNQASRPATADSMPHSEKRSEAETDRFPRFGRSLSVKAPKSRGRVEHNRPLYSTSRPTSVERESTPVPRKQTPGEAAYLRALLRDEPVHASNPLAFLRSSSSHIPSPTLVPATFAQSSTKFGHGSGLLDCLRMFTAVEILDGDNLFACHNCWKVENPLLARSRRRHRSNSGASSSSSSSSSPEIDPFQDYRLPLPSSGLTVPDVSIPRPSSAQAVFDRHGTILMEGARSIRSSIVSEPSPSRLPELAIQSRPSIDHALRENGTEKLVISDNDRTNSLPFPSAGGLTVPSISKTSPMETSADGTLVPRFRRFSSFHAEKFLSPHVSRESLASAPEFQRRPITPLALNVRSEEGVSDESAVDEAETTSAPASETDRTSLSSATRVTGTIPQHRFLGVEQLPPVVKMPKRSERVVLRRAFKRYLIDAPPPVLVIHLKRFQHISKSLFAGSAKKIDDFISFPEYLDLRPFLAPKKERYGLDQRGRTPRDGSAQRKKYHHHRLFAGKDEEEPPTWYRLYAVVVHTGSMIGGHYTAYTALSPKPATLTPISTSPGETGSTTTSDTLKRPSNSSPRKWCYISDTIVRPAEADEVFRSKAYLLFYEKVGH